MELRHLRHLVAVAEAGSISGAARQLGVSQPTVSACIAALEEQVDTNLIERHARGIRFTFAGRNLVRAARRILADADQALDRTRRSGAVELGVLKIGFYTSLSAGLLRDTLGAFHKTAPDVTLELHEGNPTDLLGKLRDGAVELVLTVLEVSDAEFATQPLWDEALIAALPPDHPLAARDGLVWSDLEGQPLVVRTWESGPAPYSFLATRIAPNGYLPTEPHHVSREALLALVGIGRGITVLGASAGAMAMPNVVFRPMVGEGATMPVNAVWLAGNDNPARGRFVSMLRDWVPETAQAPSD